MPGKLLKYIFLDPKGYRIKNIVIIMVHLSYSEGALFFGAILLGISSGILGTFWISSLYDVFPSLKKVSWLMLILTTLVLGYLIIVSLSNFSLYIGQPDSVSSTDNMTCTSQNVTNVVNNYNVSISQYYIDRKPQVVSIEELKYLMQSK